MSELNETQRKILTMFATANRPVKTIDVIEKLEPKPNGVVSDTPEWRAWINRLIDLYEQTVPLYENGYIAELIEDMHGPFTVSITDAGRKALGE